MPITLLLCIILLITLAAWMYRQFYKKHNLGQDAPEQQVNVMIIDKQTIDIPEAQPGQEDQEHWIYVQKLPTGPKREFKIGIHYYSVLTPGDKGILTYRGDQFLHFALQRKS